MHKIEDLKIWQKSILLAKEVYKVVSDLPNDEKYGLTSQIKGVQFQLHQILQKEPEEIRKMNLGSF